MIARVIEGSARNPVLVILCVLLFAAWGAWAVFEVPLDAIPDLSDVQVIIYSEWQGQAQLADQAGTCGQCGAERQPAEARAIGAHRSDVRR